MTKGEIFSTSAKCPKCGSAFNMRVSDNPNYAYQCMECDEDFYSIEIKETASDLWEFTFKEPSKNWFQKNKETLKKITKKWGAIFLGLDDACPDNNLVDIGWKHNPFMGTVQGVTDEIIALLKEVG